MHLLSTEIERERENISLTLHAFASCFHPFSTMVFVHSVSLSLPYPHPLPIIACSHSLLSFPSVRIMGKHGIKLRMTIRLDMLCIIVSALQSDEL